MLPDWKIPKSSWTQPAASLPHRTGRKIQRPPELLVYVHLWLHVPSAGGPWTLPSTVCVFPQFILTTLLEEGTDTRVA